MPSGATRMTPQMMHCTWAESATCCQRMWQTSLQMVRLMHRTRAGTPTVELEPPLTTQTQAPQRLTATRLLASPP